MGCVSSDAVTIKVPQIPNWDGQVQPLMFLPVEIKMVKTSILWNGDMSVNMQPVTNAIIAGKTAGAGFRLKAVFLPVQQLGQGRGTPLDGYSTGLDSWMARAMCIFQKEAAVPIETKFYHAPVTFKEEWLGEVSARGYERLYAQLGQASQDGFPLSCIIDDPNNRMNGFLTVSSQTTVVLTCQRRHEYPASKHYQFASVPINMQRRYKDIERYGYRASMPELIPTLRDFSEKGYRIAGVYNPPTISNADWSWTRASCCHIIFEKADRRHIMSVIDCCFTASASFVDCTVNHNQYQSIITQYVLQGWEFAGMIDLPDQHSDGLSLISTIKLLFQAAILPSDLECYSDASAHDDALRLVLEVV
eukprot:TRINITY_DN48402_c0_g1_i1.p1 TRINITY_DN48402_c0_g1~~TRINITY_DN48402_c0_g1_i1.p1  ORF type:complete len:380 (-),score=22.43 TRINITY_DN48402_c0_g1_i1:219-1301(-)